MSLFLYFSVELYSPGRVHQAWERWAGLCSGGRGQWEHTESEGYLLWGRGRAGWSSQSGWHPFGGMSKSFAHWFFFFFFSLIPCGRFTTSLFVLQVNGIIVSGLSHNKVVDILRKAEGTVQLTVCRDILPMSTCPGSSSPVEASEEFNTSNSAGQQAWYASPALCLPPLYLVIYYVRLAASFICLCTTDKTITYYYCI